ncbi:AAA family ATPase [Gemmatimonadota bacterium Y43]|uniref:AAA family ATPase n=1 Tax=Gaopeijia maritima TaxID=3119007 RepID=UPI003290080E
MTDRPFVRLYGGPLIVVGEGRPALTPAQRRLLAIVYLDAPDPVSREEVSWLLWEVGETAETRHRIRQLVYGINRDAPCPVIEREGDLLVPCLRTDCDQAPPSLSPPLRLVTPCGTTAFEHWLDTARDRLGRRRVDRLAAALDAAAAAHDFAAVCQSAELLAEVGAGQLGAEAILDLAWALQGLGRHREASLVLRRAMESDIDGPFVAAHQAVRSVTPLVRRQREPTPTLIGRGSMLRDLLRLATSGSRGAVIYGPAAIGKSAILRETVRQFSTRFPDRPIASSFHDWSFGTEPFGLARTLLRSERLANAFTSSGITPSPVLSVAFPDLARLCGTPTPPPHMEPQPTAISRDLRDLLVDALDGKSLVLFVDDLGTADESSAELIADVLADERIHAVLFGAVTAPNKQSSQVALRRLDHRLEALEAVPVGELDQDSSSLLLREANSSLPADIARKIYRALGGIPGYLLAAAPRALSPTGLPESVAEVADEHLSRLGAGDRLLLLDVGGQWCSNAGRAARPGHGGTHSHRERSG